MNMSAPALALAGELAQCWWPISRLGEAFELLLSRSKLASASVAEPLGDAPCSKPDIDDWFIWASEQRGVEAVPVSASLKELQSLLQSGGPTMMLQEHKGAAGFLCIRGSRRGGVRMLTPEGCARTVAPRVIIDAMAHALEQPYLVETARILAATDLDSKRAHDVRDALLAERLADERLGCIWLLRLPASAPFWRQLVLAGIPRQIAAVLFIFVLIYSLEIAGWRLVGSAALDGRLDFGWLVAWLLLTLTLVPWRLAGNWCEARFALDTSRILKSRLLAGALAMESGTVKHSGVGHLISRVMESQALESLVLSGGMTVAVAVMELFFAGWVVGQGIGDGTLAVLLVGWSFTLLALAWRYHVRLRIWSGQRLDMTHNLIEAMTGHRTRLAQERPDRRNTAEDAAMDAYYTASTKMDRAGLAVMSIMPSGWIAIALLGLMSAFTAKGAVSPAAIAISLGGMLLAQRAFAGIAQGLAGLSRAAFAWREVAPLFHAGGKAAGARFWLSPEQIKAAGEKDRLIDAQGLNFGYAVSGDRIIADTDLSIQRGDRILLEGASGGGKSTLAALLTGLEQPDSGLLLLGGLDRHTLGDNWHRLATCAPQFHENHILSGTLAFNLLMGRQWPARDEDIAEAETLCAQLGLGEMLERMPGGIHQRVGETGWQLSHGERSRIFLARALLQGAPLTIMDESFAALDPATLEQCLQCAFARAETLVVIAHP